MCCQQIFTKQISTNTYKKFDQFSLILANRHKNAGVCLLKSRVFKKSIGQLNELFDYQLHN